jgi:hypothetical protein
MVQDVNKKIDKASWVVVEEITQCVVKNVASFVQDTKALNAQFLPRLLTLIDTSIKEGHYRGSRVFNERVRDLLNEHLKPSLPLIMERIPGRRR